MSYVAALFLFAAGACCLALAAPRRRWDSAMGRLQTRIRSDLGVGTRNTAEIERRSTLAREPAPGSIVDRTIDRFVDFLRATIRTRAFPRAVMVAVALCLLALALGLYLAASNGGPGGHSEDLRFGPTWSRDDGAVVTNARPA